MDQKNYETNDYKTTDKDVFQKWIKKQFMPALAQLGRNWMSVMSFYVAE